MKNTPAQIAQDKLDSNLRKAHARVHKASDELNQAKSAPNAGTNFGKKTIRQKQQTLNKAQRSLARYEHASLLASLPPGPPSPPAPRPRRGRI